MIYVQTQRKERRDSEEKKRLYKTYFSQEVQKIDIKLIKSQERATKKYPVIVENVYTRYIIKNTSI